METKEWVDTRDPSLKFREWQDGLCDWFDTTVAREEVQELEELVKQTQDLFDLNDWQFRIGFAAGDKLEEMRLGDQTAIIHVDDTDETKLATIYFNRERLGVVEDCRPERVVRHELAHVFLNPSLYPGGCFRTGMQADEAQAAHLEMACERLITDKNLRIRDPEDLAEIVDKSWWVCWLDENDWRIHIEKKSGIYDGEERLPAFAHSLWRPQESSNSWGWGLFGARQISLEVDEKYVEENGLYLADVILREMMRIVLNPYGRERTSIEEQKLGKIMKVMKKVGWGELELGLAAKRGYHFRRLQRKARRAESVPPADPDVVRCLMAHLAEQIAREEGK